MKKITIEIEVDDDFQPCTYGCEMQCPFGYTDDNYCYHICYDDEHNWTCPINEAMKKEKKENE